jgi:predicted PurR-regulated permease PerM
LDHSSEQIPREQYLLLRYFKFALILLALLAIDQAVGFVYEARALFIPFIVAVFITIMLSPLLKLFDKWHIPRMFSILVTLSITVGLVLFISEIFVSSIQAFMQGYRTYGSRFDTLVKDFILQLGISPEVLTGEKKIMDDPRAAELFSSFSLSDFIGSMVAALNNLFSKLILMFLFLIFFLLGRNHLITKSEKIFSAETHKKLVDIVANISYQTQKYLLVKTLISLLTGGLVVLILLAFGVEFPLVWGLLTFFFNFIPNIGSLIATVLPLLFSMIQFESWAMIFWLAVCLIVVQFLMGNIFEPKLMGESVNLSPVVILFSLIFWSFILGYAGMFLAIPLTVIVKIIFENIEELRPIGLMMGGIPAEKK